MDERYVSFTDKDKPISREDVPGLEQALGYKIDVPDDFFEEPEEERIFDRFLDVLSENKKAILLDWKWNAEELFEQLIPIYPELNIKLLSSATEGKVDTHEIIERMEYEIDGQTAQAAIPMREGPFRWIEVLNSELAEKTGTVLVQYDTAADEMCWFKAKQSFSEEEFNAVTSAGD